MRKYTITAHVGLKSHSKQIEATNYADIYGNGIYRKGNTEVKTGFTY